MDQRSISKGYFEPQRGVLKRNFIRVYIRRVKSDLLIALLQQLRIHREIIAL